MDNKLHAYLKSLVDGQVIILEALAFSIYNKDLSKSNIEAELQDKLYDQAELMRKHNAKLEKYIK